MDHNDLLDDYSKYPEYDAKDDFGKSPLLEMFEEPTTKSEFQKKSFDSEDSKPQPESPQVLNLFTYFSKISFLKMFV